MKINLTNRTFYQNTPASDHDDGRTTCKSITTQSIGMVYWYDLLIKNVSRIFEVQQLFTHQQFQ